MKSDLRVLFVHGLESGPSGQKAVYLGERFRALTPKMDTKSFAGSVDLQAQALRDFEPDVLVGSSFGGAVAVALLDRGAWRGPTLLLAPAAGYFGVTEALPPHVPILIVHGKDDNVVAIEGSRRLAKTGTPALVQLVEVDDGHRLQTLVERDELAGYVRRVAALGGRARA